MENGCCHIMVTVANFLEQIQYQISYAVFQLHTRSIIPEIFILGVLFLQLKELENKPFEY